MSQRLAILSYQAMTKLESSIVIRAIQCFSFAAFLRYHLRGLKDYNLVIE